MTEPTDAVTVGELIEYLQQYRSDAPVAVRASGAYDFLDSAGLDESELIESVAAEFRDDVAVFLNGDIQ
jgi:hypothetical protein